MSLEVIDITFGEFREWLYNHPDEFFYANGPAWCPIAKFIKGTRNHERVSVGCGKVFLDYRGSKQMSLPEWADEFVKDFDFEFHASGRVFSTDVIHFMDNKK